MNQEINESISETKLYGFPKPFAGAVIGVTLFTIILLLFWMKGSQDSAPVIALLLPGIGAIDLLGLPSDKLPISNFTQKVLVYAIEYMISCFPSAILGFLLVSRRTKILGISLLIIYCVVLLIYGLFTYVFLVDI